MDKDFIWLAIIELWNRVIPERCSIEMIDNLMQEGYEDIELGDYKSGMKSGKKRECDNKYCPFTSQICKGCR